MAAESGLRHACGVFGCILSGDKASEELDVAHLIYTGLVGLQHRGQESAGIVTSRGHENSKFKYHKGMGLVGNVFSDEVLKDLQGFIGIGHTRYSTAGGSDWVHCQPFVVHSIHGPLALAHNGELVNASPLRQEVLERGVGLSTQSDSELITQMLCLTPPQGEPNGPNWKARIEHLMMITPLSYALVILHKDKIYGVRDVYGNRPLSIATLQPPGALPCNYNEETNQVEGDIDGWAISSETCAFLPIGAHFLREVLPGEIVELSKKGLRSLGRVELAVDKKVAFCIFEYVYFARPDSFFEGQMVYNVRVRSGQQLAIESPVEADLVGSVPESGTPAAKGYATQAGLPFVEVLCRNRYIGRTFIQPSSRLRKLGIAKKFGALVGNFEGKRIVLVDDSIVRGNTMGPIIKLLRDAGAREVHIRIASPPVRHPCYMGINIPTKEELIATSHNEEKLAKHIGADSLAYLTVEGLTTAVTSNIDSKDKKMIGHCTACLTGIYPVELEW